MGGSTDTVLHLLAAAHEAECDFTMADIDRLSRRVPVLCKAAPSVANVNMEDVHRAGGIMADALARWDIAQTQSESVRSFYSAAPGGVPTQIAFSQDRRFSELDLDRQIGVIRDKDHAHSQDGGLAVLSGNLALDGCIVKTAGVEASILTFSGPAVIFESPPRRASARSRRR